VISVQDFELFIDFALQSGTFVIDCAELDCLIIALFLKSFELRRCLASLLLDVCEELEEVLGVFLKHLFRAYKTELPHLIEVCKAFNFFVFLFKQHLYQEHLSLLLNEIPSVLSVLRSFNGHVKAGSFCNIYLVGDVWVNR